MPATGAGSRDCHLTVQRAAKPWPQDPKTRQPIPAWEDYCHPWASMREPKGTEVAAAGQIISLQSRVFEFPSDSKTRQITPDEQWRIVHVSFGRTTYYNIKAPLYTPRTGMVAVLVEARAEA